MRRLVEAVDALGAQVFVRLVDVHDLERDVVDAGILLAEQRMDLEDRLVLARQLQLGRAAMMLRPAQKFESQLLIELDVLLYVAHDDLDVVDADDHSDCPVCQIAYCQQSSYPSACQRMKKHTAQTLELPERRSLASVIFEELERMILSGALKPGQPINEKALSDNNGLSRGPIREACRRLEQAGLIEIIVNRGAFVRRISHRSAAELCDIRVLLAGYAGRLAASRITDEQIAALTDLMKMIEAEIEAGNLTEFYRLNYDFHMTIIEASGNQRLAGSTPPSTKS